uniref:DUF8040 domain-containing protein n=1 Tax=Fagus sylvatica TaxID=28930 RepID=A0A2N9IG57_FAGSY
MSIKEQVVIFLHTIGHNVRFRVAAGRFHRSVETIHRYFRVVLKGVFCLYKHVVRLPDNETHPDIRNNRRFYPYFKDCIGAIDGTHIRASVPIEIQGRFRGRKDGTTQNVLAAITFDLKFCYVLAGWEGSAYDSRVLDDALHRSRGLKIPEGAEPFWSFETQVEVVLACCVLHNHIMGVDPDDPIMGDTTSDTTSEAHPTHVQYLNKKIEFYDKMAIVVGKDVATGGYAFSWGDETSHNPPVELDGESDSARGSFQLKEIAIAFKNQGPVDANELYEAVMSTEGFAEEMLASAFDYMIQEEKVGRAFMAKAPRLRKLWLENYFTKNM